MWVAVIVVGMCHDECAMKTAEAVWKKDNDKAAAIGLGGGR